MKALHLPRNRAFSLIEVSIAMGIFAFAIVVILGLMGSAIKSTRDSEERIAASNLAALMFARYQSGLQDIADGGSAFSWANFPLPKTPEEASGPAEWESGIEYIDAFGNTVSGPQDAAFALKFISTASGIGAGNLPTDKAMVVKCALQFSWPAEAAESGKAINSYTATTSFVITSRK